MGNIGASELIVILMILLLVFGASRLPALGEAFGRTIRGFKRGLAQNEGIQVTEVSRPDDRTTTAPPGASQKSGAPAAELTDAEVTDADVIDEVKR